MRKNSVLYFSLSMFMVDKKLISGMQSVREWNEWKCMLTWDKTLQKRRGYMMKRRGLRHSSGAHVVADKGTY